VNDEVGEPKPVRLDRIAPDLAMVHLDRHKIKWSDLEREETKVIGVGIQLINLTPTLSLMR
jgi:hypothetical protein